MRGVFRWTKGGSEDWWVRVEVRLGEWTDVSRADYEAEYAAGRAEPHFWGLQEEQSWREGLPS